MPEIKVMMIGEQFDQGEQTCTVVERVDDDPTGAIIVFIERPAMADETENPVV